MSDPVAVNNLEGQIRDPQVEQPETPVFDRSLLENILYLKTPEQQKYFLKSVSPQDIIYANRTPTYSGQLSLQLTTKAYRQLLEIIRNESPSFTQDPQDALEPLAFLKTDLEAGVRLSTDPGWVSKETDKEMPIDIWSHLFDITCKLGFSRYRNQRCLLAIELNSSKTLQNQGANLSLKNDEQDEVSESEKDIDVNGVVPNSQLVESDVKKSIDIFIPHVQTSWEVRAPKKGEAPYVDADAIERILSEISNHRQVSKILCQAGTHLRTLGNVVRITQSAFRFPYMLYDTIHGPDSDYYRLMVKGPKETIDKIQSVYVYTATPAEDDGNSSRNATFPMRFKKEFLVLKWLNRSGELHHFAIEKGHSIPSSGFLADIGFESQIKKQLDAMTQLAVPIGKLHLMKLISFLGGIDTSKLQPYSWSEYNIEFIDKQLTERQREAVRKALSTPDICLIQGPPGTGKTRVISEIVQQATRRGWKILLTAPTHLAVDNVLERIGLKDDVSPIRCAKDKKSSDLSEYIRQFTYKERVELLPTYAMGKVREDIEQLKNEQLQIEETFKVLRNLSAARIDLTNLHNSEQGLTGSIIQLPQVVRKEFNNEIKDTNAVKDQADKSYIVSEKNLIDVQKVLETSRLRASQVRRESYLTGDMKRFKAAEQKVNEIYKKPMQNAQRERDAVAKKVASTERIIEQAQADNDEAKTIVSEITAGRIPAKVRAAIQQKVGRVSDEHDQYIATKDSAVEQAKNKLYNHENRVETLKALLASSEDMHNKLVKLKDVPWWKQLWQLVWWESLFVDYKKRKLKYSADLQNSLSLLPMLQSEVREVESSAALARVTKKAAVHSTKSSELKDQHQFYKSRSISLTVKLDRLLRQLTDEKQQLEILYQNVASIEKSVKDAMQEADEIVKKEIRKEVAAAVKNAHIQVQYHRREFNSAAETVEKAQKAILQLEELIEQTAQQRKKQLELQISQIQTSIAYQNNNIHTLEKRAEYLLNHLPPTKPADFEKTFKNLTSKLNDKENLKVFWDSWLEYLEREAQTLGNRLAKYVNLVCATTVGIASDDYFGDNKPLEQKQFDLLIIDEASKVTEPEFLVAATRAKRWVLLGDHKQLPPYYDQKFDHIFRAVNKVCTEKDLSILDPKPLRISFFETLWNQLKADKRNLRSTDARCVVLNIQRRMHPDLAMFISDMFYDREYQSPDDLEFKKEKSLGLSRFKYPVTFIEVCSPKDKPGLETDLRHMERQRALGLDQSSGFANFAEATQVIHVLAGLLKEEAVYKEQDELNGIGDKVPVIGIISFYTGQVELIRKLIIQSRLIDAIEESATVLLCKGRIRVAVNSVDSFQGKECPVIILSFTRSNLYKNIGFVDDANRLNVAMSRARKKLILLGDTKTFIKRSKTETVKEALDTTSMKAERDFFAKLVTYIEGHGEIKKAFQLLEMNNETI